MLCLFVVVLRWMFSVRCLGFSQVCYLSVVFFCRLRLWVGQMLPGRIFMCGFSSAAACVSAIPGSVACVCMRVCNHIVSGCFRCVCFSVFGGGPLLVGFVCFPSFGVAFAWLQLRFRFQCRFGF